MRAPRQMQQQYVTEEVLDRVTNAGDAAATGPGQPPVQVVLGISGLGQSVEVAQAFFELPAAVEHRAAAAQFVQHPQLGRFDGVGVLEQRPAVDPAGLSRAGGGLAAEPAAAFRVGPDGSLPGLVPFQVPAPAAGLVDRLVG